MQATEKVVKARKSDIAHIIALLRLAAKEEALRIYIDNFSRRFRNSDWRICYDKGAIWNSVSCEEIEFRTPIY